MKFYVATKWENHIEAQMWMDFLSELGHEITHDWTEHAYGDGHSRGEHAELDIKGVQDADAVVLLWYPNMLGAFIEVGAALGLGKPVYIVGEDSCFDKSIFFFHPLVKNKFELIYDLTQKVYDLSQKVAARG